jgi:hypothetical protein
MIPENPTEADVPAILATFLPKEGQSYLVRNELERDCRVFITRVTDTTLAVSTSKYVDKHRPPSRLDKVPIWMWVEALCEGDIALLE